MAYDGGDYGRSWKFDPRVQHDASFIKGSRHSLAGLIKHAQLDPVAVDVAVINLPHLQIHLSQGFGQRDAHG